MDPPRDGCAAREATCRQQDRRGDPLISPQASIEIAPYNPAWPDQFQAEALLLDRALATWLIGPIEHIGSTAILGLAAKPVVDIMAGVRTLDHSRPAIAAVTALGYCYAPYHAEIEHWFCKPSASVRTHHLHLVPVGTPQWIRPIAFRDYLRAHPGASRDYESLKRRLAEKYPFDRDAYTEGKGPFIERITDVALEMGYGPEHDL